MAVVVPESNARPRLPLPATRRTRVLSTVEKHGRTGRLTFVTVAHENSQADRVKVEERHDVVYRDAAVDDAAPRTEQQDPPAKMRSITTEDWQIDISPTLLFRFSALTYNAHRIHYDRDYAREVEGYPGLVTHGPLQALTMAEAARAHGLQAGLRTSFEYRLISPLFDHQGLIARVDAHEAQAETSIRDLWRRRTARGTVTRER